MIPYCPKKTHKQTLIAVGGVCLLVGMAIAFFLILLPLDSLLMKELHRIDRHATNNLDVVVGDIAELRHSTSAANHIIVKGLTGIKEMLVANRSVDAPPPSAPWTEDEQKQLFLLVAVVAVALVCATAAAASAVSHWVSSAGPLSHWIRGGYTSIDPTLLRTRRNYLNGDRQLGCSFTLKGQRLESIPCIYVPEVGAWMHCTAPSPLLPSSPRRNKYDTTLSTNGMIEWLWNPWANDWSWVCVMPILVGDTAVASKIEPSRNIAACLNGSVGPMLDYSNHNLTSTSDPDAACTIGYDPKHQAYCRIPVKVTRAAPHERMF